MRAAPPRSLYLDVGEDDSVSVGDGQLSVDARIGPYLYVIWTAPGKAPVRRRLAIGSSMDLIAEKARVSVDRKKGIRHTIRFVADEHIPIKRMRLVPA